MQYNLIFVLDDDAVSLRR